MAGIGQELRKLMRVQSYLAVVRAYALAGAIGSGPWLISIFGTIALGILSVRFGGDRGEITKFLATVTYLIAASLVLSGGMQLLFTRFVADRLFEKRKDIVLPNLLGAMLFTTLLSGLVGGVIVVFAFRGYVLYRALLLASFVVLNDVWLLSVFLTGMKAYRFVLLIFALGYAVTLGGALALVRYGLEGMMAGFLFGHVVLCFGMLASIARAYASPSLSAYEFLQKKKIFLDLAATGALYNIAVWIDKAIFWATPTTSQEVLGPIRSSIVYDVPIFLAYCSIVPGMAVFLVRIETDFAEHYDELFDAVREGGTLSEIERLRDGMVTAAREGLYDIFRIQGLTVILLLLLAESLMRALSIPVLYVPLFSIDVVGVGTQVVFLGVQTILFYLDYRMVALGLNALLAASNALLTILSLDLGPRFYGYGFATSVALVTVAGLVVLSRKLDRLEYETFMR
ncbi:MAG TPA: exopolysaccharide Pel transporter PelG [Polyangiaceae bacterium]|jgi:uncharacterized membrane protein